MSKLDKTMKKIIGVLVNSLLFLLMLLDGCSLPRLTHPPDAKTPTSTSTSAQETTPNPTSTATEYPSEQCGWNWATQSLPELSTQVQAAMESTGLMDIRVNAEAYGENCFTPAGDIVRFAAMETDYRITFQVVSLEDRETLGTLLEQILLVLDGFPTGTTPGPNPGYVGVTFQSGDDSLRLWFTNVDGESARALDLHGAALLDKLQIK
jgi:hypothetical protein